MLGDFRPVTHSQPNSPHRGGRRIRCIHSLELSVTVRWEINKLQNLGCDPQTGSFHSWANAHIFWIWALKLFISTNWVKLIFFKLQIQINSIFWINSLMHISSPMLFLITSACYAGNILMLSVTPLPVNSLQSSYCGCFRSFQQPVLYLMRRLWRFQSWLYIIAPSIRD